MMRLCEITLKKDQSPAGQKRPDILSRKLEVPELKSSIRLRVSMAGLKVVEEVGGLTKFLEQRDEKKLSPKLNKLKQKLIAAGKIKVKKEEAPPAEEPTAEAAPEAAAEAEASAEPAAEAPAEAPAETPAEEPKKEPKEAAPPAEEQAEEAKEAPAEEPKKEPKKAAPPAEKPAEEAKPEEAPAAEPAAEEEPQKD